ncbi:MAG: DUF1294 domain-containing protein [Clostridiales bacterium]|nr:DUF1294 domain-containing protein [Candidatus Blautia equi]
MRTEYLVILFLNVLSFLLYAVDHLAERFPNNARMKKLKVKETTLLITSFLGMAGALAGLYGLKHKIKDEKFHAKILELLLLNVFLWIAYYLRACAGVI